MPYKSQAQRAYMHINHPGIAKRWDKEYASKKKVPIVKKKLKGALGKTDFDSKNRPTKITIDVKKHKGDKAELASTIKHELMHVKYPKMTEKEVYKKTAKTKIPQSEQSKLLAKLKIKSNFKPGEAISKMNEMKRSNTSNKKTLSEKQVAIRGLV